MFFNHWWIRQAVKGRTTRVVWGHAPLENFEILVLWNAISSVLRGQILSKMFSKSIVLSMLIFIGVTLRRSSQFYFIQVVRFLKLLWISLSAKYTLCGVIVWVSKEFIWKFQNNCRNLKFSYPERILIGIRDFRAKSEVPRRDQDD